MAQTVNINMNQGETWRWAFVWASPDPASTAEVPLPPIPFDLSECMGQLQVRERYGAEILVELVTGLGITLGATGEVVVEFSAGETDLLGATSDPAKPRRKALYDLEITFPSNDVKRVIEGAIAIVPNITRSLGAGL